MRGPVMRGPVMRGPVMRGPVMRGPVMPAKAGIHVRWSNMDPRFRGDDEAFAGMIDIPGNSSAAVCSDPYHFISVESAPV